MKIVIKIIKLFLSQIFLSGIVFTIKAEIGVYPNVTLSGCGFGRQSEYMFGSCFEWHNNKESSIKDGRDVTDGEMPFTVFIYIHRDSHIYPHNPGQCSGSILNQNWIITAAHCLREKNLYNKIGGSNVVRIRVRPGLRIISEWDYKSNTSLWYDSEPGLWFNESRYFIHPEYNESWSNSNKNTLESSTWDYDIGLIQLDRSIPLNSTSPFTNLNSVCLPNAGLSFANTSNEYVMLSGWGGGTNTLTLQMGWNIISNESTDKRIRIKYEHNKNKDRAIFCGGDSGGPLVQYVRGRAVLVGIVAGLLFRLGGCGSRNTKFHEFNSVGVKVQWIVDTVRNYSNV